MFFFSKLLSRIELCKIFLSVLGNTDFTFFFEFLFTIKLSLFDGCWKACTSPGRSRQQGSQAMVFRQVPSDGTTASSECQMTTVFQETGLQIFGNIKQANFVAQDMDL